MMVPVLFTTTVLLLVEGYDTSPLAMLCCTVHWGPEDAEVFEDELVVWFEFEESFAVTFEELFVVESPVEMFPVELD